MCTVCARAHLLTSAACARASRASSPGPILPNVQWYFENFCGISGAEFEERRLGTLDASAPIERLLNGFVKPYDGASALRAVQRHARQHAPVPYSWMLPSADLHKRGAAVASSLAIGAFLSAFACAPSFVCSDCSRRHRDARSRTARTFTVPYPLLHSAGLSGRLDGGAPELRRALPARAQRGAARAAPRARARPVQRGGQAAPARHVSRRAPTRALMLLPIGLPCATDGTATGGKLSSSNDANVLRIAPVSGAADYLWCAFHARVHLSRSYQEVICLSAESRAAVSCGPGQRGVTTKL